MAVDGQGPTLITRWTAAGAAGAAMAGAGKLASVQQDLPGPVVVGQPPAACKAGSRSGWGRGALGRAASAPGWHALLLHDRTGHAGIGSRG